MIRKLAILIASCLLFSQLPVVAKSAKAKASAKNSGRHTCLPYSATRDGSLPYSATSGGSLPYSATSDWKTVDARLKSQVYQLNATVKLTLDDGAQVELVGMSKRHHYPVFATTTKDNGFRVVGYGTCFPIVTNEPTETYFVTSKHVVDFADGMAKECQRFFAALRMHAEKTAAFGSVEERYGELLRIVNLGVVPTLRATERQVYETTIDEIWDTYDNYLSVRVDPNRGKFKKYLVLSGCQTACGFFIHSPGESLKAPLSAVIYKQGSKPGEPDLCVLQVKNKRIPGLRLANTSPIPGQVVHAIGYPLIKHAGVDTPTTYVPTLTAGYVRRTTGGTVQFEAPVSKGDSGGPLVDQRGDVVGVVVRRALSQSEVDTTPGYSPNNEFATAVSAKSLREFAWELFKVKRP